MDFSTMTARELTAEIEQFQAQLYAQQSAGRKITPAQNRRFIALRRAYCRAWADLAK